MLAFLGEMVTPWALALIKAERECLTSIESLLTSGEPQPSLATADCRAPLGMPDNQGFASRGTHLLSIEKHTFNSASKTAPPVTSKLKNLFQTPETEKHSVLKTNQVLKAPIGLLPASQNRGTNKVSVA